MKTPNTNKKKLLKKNLLGFTLVELIVVISILAVLGTIAMISFSGYLMSARDSVRISALNDIHKALTITNIKTGSYPLPDDYITIVGVSKQGYIGDSVTRIIKISGSVVDPLDKTRYMYTIDGTGKKIQISTFLEESNTQLFSQIPSLINKAFASTIDYTNRFIYNFGERVGMLFDSETKAPVTEIVSSGSIDLTTSTTPLTAIFSNSTASGTTSGTGQNLLTNISIIQNSCVLGNTVVTNGGQLTAYNTTTVAYNQTCIPVQRICNNGVLSGDTNYKYDTCSPAAALNCSPTTHNGYSIPTIAHNATQNITKDITGGIADMSISCTNGVLSYESENVNCNNDYALDNGQCMENLCIGSAPDWSILNGIQKYNVSWNYNNTSGQCAFVCQAGYYWNTSNCTPASAGYTVTSSGQTTQTACNANTDYQNLTGQSACKTVQVGYYSTPIGTVPHTNQVQCEANNYCINGIKIACDTGYSSPAGSTSSAACTLNTYTISGSFGSNANGATINVCGTDVIADTSGNFTTNRNYNFVCNTITATRTNYTCFTTTQGPANLTSNISNIVGNCTTNNFTVTFNGNTNTSGTMSAQSIPYTTSANLTANAFVKTGYTFAGWATSTAGAVAYANSASYTMGAANVTLYAKWTANNCTAGSYTFNAHTYSVPAYTSSATGSVTSSSVAITNGTQTFTTVWGCNAGVVSTYSTEGANTPVCNTNYTWNSTSCSPNNFTVTFNGNTNTSGTMSAQSIPYTTSANLTANAFVKTGYTFAGWATSAGGAVAYTNSASYTMGAANVTLYAKWTQNPSCGTANGVATLTAPSTSLCTIGTSSTVTTSTSNFTWTCSNAPATTASCSAPRQYTVTFNSNGGGTPSPTTKSVTYNTAVGTLATVSRTGYAFNGWFTATTGGTAITTATVVTANVTWYAQWTANGCTTSTQTVNTHSYSVSAFNHGTTTSPTSIIAITNGTRTYQQTFSCTAGVVATSGGETNTANTCNTNYTWNGTSCTANTQTYTCTAKITNSDWNTVSSYIQTWNGSAWLPANSTTAYNTTASTSSCNYKCSTNFHTENAGVSCISNTRSCTITNGVGSQTWNTGTSAWNTCTVVSCNTGYTVSGNSCISAFTCGTSTVTAGGYTYTTKLGPDGKCWTSQNMKHTPSTGARYVYGTEILYDWTAATSTLCSQLGTGWALPTHAQWTALTNAGATGWLGNKFSGIISSLPGLYEVDWGYDLQPSFGYWWSSTQYDASTAWYRELSFGDAAVFAGPNNKTSGYSVVCLKN